MTCRSLKYWAQSRCTRVKVGRIIASKGNEIGEKKRRKEEEKSAYQSAVSFPGHRVGVLVYSTARPHSDETEKRKSFPLPYASLA